MINKLLLLAPLLIASTGISGKEHKLNNNDIYHRIMVLQPTLDPIYVLKLSAIINQQSKLYNINPILDLGILNQESGLKNVIRTVQITKYDKKCTTNKKGKKSCKNIKVIIREDVDIGIGQINTNTANSYGLSIDRLKTDIEYNLKAHFKILEDKIEMCSALGRVAWSCYNSNSPINRAAYEKAVSRFLPKGYSLRRFTYKKKRAKK